jgi:iron(III) transport system substrate-binding protein
VKIALLGRGGLPLAVLAFGLIAGALHDATAAERQPVVAYGVLQKPLLNSIKERFEVKNPDLELFWISDSSGVVGARIRAEGTSQQADVAMGIGLTEVENLIADGFVAPYTPKGAADVPQTFRDTAEPARWTAFSGYTALICFNTREANGVAAPAGFTDLLRPEFKGRVVLPHPVSSGTGYLVVSGVLQKLGESAGWAFLDALHQNVAFYVHSGSAPCVQAARGEHLVGVGVDAAGASQKIKGAPIALIVPAEGAPWDLNTSILLNNAPHPEAARRLLDFTLSAEMAAVSSQYSAIIPHGNANPEANGFPAVRTDQLAVSDFQKMGKDRKRILAEWTKRYEGKAEPKQ